MGLLLRDWIAREKVPLAAFAARIGVANASVVHKYVNGRMPRKREVIDAIHRETGGQVGLADLYAAASER